MGRGKSGLGSGSGGGTDTGGAVYGGEYGTLTQKAVDELIALGARRWQKDGKDRLYIGEAGDAIIGLEVETYRSTGNVSYAE